MLDRLLHGDIALFRLINQDWKNFFFDVWMPLLSYSPLFWGALITIGLGVWCVQYRRRTTCKEPLSAELSGNDGFFRMAGSKAWICPLLLIALSLGTSDLAAKICKKSLARPRPQHSLAGVHFMEEGVWQRTPAGFQGKASRNYSFFSSHAANSMVLATTLAVLVPPAAPLLFALSGAVGYSRIYTGKHYPSDILAGWLIGWLIATLYGRMYKRLLKEY